jgi:arylsulfatase A-like enzyme
LPGRKRAARITNDLLRWLDHRPEGRPFFAFLNYFDAHHPYLPPQEFLERFGPTAEQSSFQARYRQGPCTVGNTTAEEAAAIRNGYDAAIAYLDTDLNRLFGALSHRCLLDDTLVIVVSDHGEEFGEHAVYGHGETTYLQSLLVPLILRWPTHVPAGTMVDRGVTLRDVPATVTELLGLPDDGRWVGTSLSRYWRTSNLARSVEDEPMFSELIPAPWRRHRTFVSKGEMKSLLWGDLHYVCSADGSEEIYDIQRDPAEHDNLLDTQRACGFVTKAREAMRQMSR